jgi:hypothetical protein
MHAESDDPDGRWICRRCGRQFTPIYDPSGRPVYCSVPCRTAAVTHRQSVYRQAELAAKNGTLTPRQIARLLRELPERTPLRAPTTKARPRLRQAEVIL